MQSFKVAITEHSDELMRFLGQTDDTKFPPKAPDLEAAVSVLGELA